MIRRAAQIDRETFPDALAGVLDGAAVFDSSCSAAAQTYFLDKDDGYYLKVEGAGCLKTEALMTAFFHRLGLSAEVLYYETAGGKDFRLTRKIPGEDCTYARYREAPERLCDTVALLLRQLHETPAPDCPVPDRNKTYTGAVRKGFDAHGYEPDLFKAFWEFPSFEETCRTAEEGMKNLKREVLLHGDYCLPNILLDDWKFSGFIDLRGAGIGDRHIDILWGIWTLNYNLKTDRYTQRFIDAYGRDLTDKEKLRQIAAMEIIGG